MKERILIVAPYTPSLVRFRGDFLKSLVDLGYEVITCAPDEGNDDSIAKLRELGVRFISVDLERQGLSLIRDLQYSLQVYRILQREKPTISFHYSTKPIIFGTVLAKLARVPKIVTMMTGLGFAFTNISGFQHRLVHLIGKIMYRLALRVSDVAIFHNQDDAATFRQLGILSENRSIEIVNGSGVDTEFFYFNEQQRIDQLSFLLVARLLKNKGILEFLEAANILKKQYPEVNFVLLGPEDGGPAAIKLADLNLKNVTYVGFQKDVRPYIENANVFVLPSYREGTPRSVLEAMSMGKPIICSDVPGCRNTVVEGYNGFLVPHKNVEQLVEAMGKFIVEPNLIDSMGKASRSLVEERFEVSKVTKQMLKAMQVVPK